LEVAVLQVCQEYFLVCGASNYVGLISLFPVKAKVFLACHEGIWGSGCIVPLILNHCTRCGWVVSFVLRSCYSWMKEPLLHMQ